MKHKLLITSSGTGSRLGELTKSTNKALLQIGGKEIIAHIIDSYPKDIEIVVTLGFQGAKVKKYLNEQYPERNISYVEVDKFEGPGSSLGYSLLQAKDVLACPFIFHCNDTIVDTNFTEVATNWAAGYSVSDSSQYTTFNIEGDTISSYNTQKGVQVFDFAHIGIAGIYEYEKFFTLLERLYNENPCNSSLNDVYVLDSMIRSGSLIKYKEVKQWLDTGNLQSLAEAERKIGTL